MAKAVLAEHNTSRRDLGPKSEGVTCLGVANKDGQGRNTRSQNTQVIKMWPSKVLMNPKTWFGITLAKEKLDEKLQSQESRRNSNNFTSHSMPNQKLGSCTYSPFYHNQNHG